MKGQREVPRIGELLVSRGVLTESQRDVLLACQKRRPRPLGVLAEQLIGIDRREVQSAWAEQYLALQPLVSLRGVAAAPEALALLTRRQAWQLRLLPLRREAGFWRVATTPSRLVRAANYLWRSAIQPVRIVVADEADLEAALQRHYPWPGVSVAGARRVLQAAGWAAAGGVIAPRGEGPLP